MYSDQRQSSAQPQLKILLSEHITSNSTLGTLNQTILSMLFFYNITMSNACSEEPSASQTESNTADTLTPIASPKEGNKVVMRPCEMKYRGSFNGLTSTPCIRRLKCSDKRVPAERRPTIRARSPHGSNAQ